MIKIRRISFGVRLTWVLFLPLNSCMILYKLFNLFEPQCKMWIKASISWSYWLNSITNWCVQFLAHWKHSKNICHHYYYIGTVRRPNLPGVKSSYREQFIHSINTFCELATYQELFWTISMPSWRFYFSFRRETINKQASKYMTGSDKCYRKLQSGIKEKGMTTKSGGW